MVHIAKVIQRKQGLDTAHRKAMFRWYTQTISAMNKY